MLDIDGLARLTQEEVDDLPIGSKVMIQWSGSDTKREYEIEDKCGGQSLVKKFPENAGWWYGQINFVGFENCHTKVWLVED